MTNIKDIIINETVADVLAVLALNSSLPRIDRLYTAYKFEAIQSGELWGTYTRLFREGILALDENGRTAKGPKETLIYSKTQLLPPDKSRPPERCRDEKSNKSAPP